MNAVNSFFVWYDICYDDLNIHHFFYSVVVKCDHLTAIKLNSPAIFGMAGV